MPLIFENMNEKEIKEPQLCINCIHFNPKSKWASDICMNCHFYETNQQSNYESTKPKS